MTQDRLSTNTENETEYIRYLLENHRKIETRVGDYLQLVNDLLHDCEVVYRNDTELFYVVDFSLFFDKLFPLLSSRRGEPSNRIALTRRLRDSIAEKVLINFFFKICPRKVLLKVYAEEYKNFYLSNQNRMLRLSLEGRRGKKELFDRIADDHCYFGLWKLSLPTFGTTAEVEATLHDEINKALGEFSRVLQEGHELFTTLVDAQSNEGLVPLAEALEGQSLPGVSTESFEPLREMIKHRGSSSIQNDINALSIIRALNETCGREAVDKETSERTSLPTSSGKTKRFVFVTRDNSILKGITHQALDVELPPLSGGAAEDISFCRSLDHFLLLYMCHQEVRPQETMEIEELTQEQLKKLVENLTDQRDTIKEYLSTIDEADGWLKDKDRELQNPRITEAIACRYPHAAEAEHVNPRVLQEKVNSFEKSKEFKNIMGFNRASLLGADLVSVRESAVPRITSRHSFVKAVEAIRTVTPRLQYRGGNPFLQIERVRKQLDVIIALFDTPIWNRYTGFHYESPDPGDHPRASQLTQTAALLRDRSPAKNASALELLFSLAEDKGSGLIWVDPLYNAMLSKAYRVQGRYDKSIRICQRVAYLNPRAGEHPELCFEKGLSLKFQRGKYRAKDSKELARALFEKAYTQDPRDPRFVYELATAEWRLVEADIDRLVEKVRKNWPDELVSSHREIVDIVNKQRKEITSALELLQAWLKSYAETAPPRSTLHDHQKALFVLMHNACAYWRWILALQSKEALATKPTLLAETEMKIQGALEVAKDAYDLFTEVDNQRLAQSVRLHILETLIQIKLSLCELAALKLKADVELLESIENDLSQFECTPDFEGCYHNIHDEYAKFRRIYSIYHLAHGR